MENTQELNKENNQSILLQNFITELQDKTNSATIPPTLLIESAINDLKQIATNNIYEDNFSIQDALLQVCDRINQAALVGLSYYGLPSGFEGLDKLLNGFQSKRLYIIGSRPSVGKTAFMVSMATNILSLPESKKVVIFSLSLSKLELVNRFLSCSSEIPLEKIVSGKLEEAELKDFYNNGIEQLLKQKLFIDDSAILSIAEMRKRLLKLKLQNDVDIVFVDYLQLIKSVSGRYRDEQLAHIMGDLKLLARELDLPIVLMSQLNRAVELRREGEKIPQLSDLRDSGAIEQEADVVMFLYRPDYYEIAFNDCGEGMSSKEETYLKIAKNNSGPIDTLKFRAQLHIQKFIEEDVFNDTLNLQKGPFSKLFDQKEIEFEKPPFDDNAPF